MADASVLLATGSQLFADALCATLAGTSLEAVGPSHDVDTTIGFARTLQPDLVVLAAPLPGTGGALGACRRLMADESLHCVILFVGDPGGEEEMKAALEAGALGYATASSTLAELVEDMHGVVAGEARVPRLLLGSLLRSLITRERRSSVMLDRYASLSRRERQTLGLLAQGHDHAGIAADMVISPETARTHIQNVLGKLGVHSRLEAATLAIEHGWVPSGREVST
jgi:two-component system, NarL family, nitrate/nitrite response regulator NarL